MGESPGAVDRGMKTLRQGDNGYVTITKPSESGYDSSAPTIPSSVVQEKTTNQDFGNMPSQKSRPEQRQDPNNRPDSKASKPHENTVQTIEQRNNVPSSSSKEADFLKMEFSELNRLRKNFSIDSTERKIAEDEFNRRVNKFKDLKEGETVNRVRHTYLNVVVSHEWDELYTAIEQSAEDLERRFEDSSLGRNNPELQGVITEILYVERAQLLLEGMRIAGVDRNNVEWLKNHGFTQRDYDRFQELVRPVNSVLDIERTDVDTLAKMVGRDIRKQQSTIQPSLTPDQMASAVKQGTENALSIPSRETELQNFRDAEREIMEIAPVNRTTKFLVKENGKSADAMEIMTWNARAQLSSACNRKLMAPSINEIVNNEKAKALTIEQEQLLLSIPGVLEAVSLEAHIIVNDLNPNFVLRSNIDLPPSIFAITNEKALNAFREAKVEWLHNFRGLTETEARDAEAVSRNWVYLNDLVEDFDSKFDKDDNLTKPDHKYIPASMSKLRSLNVWIAMHPLERLTAKTLGLAVWGALGSWALSRRSIGNVLPPNLFKSGFETGKSGPEIDSPTLIDTFIENGIELATDPRAINIITPQISHSEATEGRMAKYCSTISDAATVVNAVANPGAFKQTNNWGALGTALRELNVSIAHRQNIVMAIRGLDTTKPFLWPLEGITSFNKFLYGNEKDSLRSYDSKFFARKESIVKTLFNMAKKKYRDRNKN